MQAFNLFINGSDTIDIPSFYTFRYIIILYLKIDLPSFLLLYDRVFETLDPTYLLSGRFACYYEDETYKLKPS